MDYEKSRMQLQLQLNSVIAEWLKNSDMKSWAAERQVAIVLDRMRNAIRATDD